MGDDFDNLPFGDLDDWGIHRREDSSQDEDGHTFSGVKVLKATGKALRTRFSSGAVWWVPVSQVVGPFPAVGGEPGDLTVTGWLVDRWAEEGFDPDRPDKSVSVKGVVCLREGRDAGSGPKAILVQMPGAEEIWIPTSQILPSSEVHRDGDGGTLVLTAWFAEKEGITPDGKAAPTAQSDVTDGVDDDGGIF